MRAAEHYGLTNKLEILNKHVTTYPPERDKEREIENP